MWLLDYALRARNASLENDLAVCSVSLLHKMKPNADALIVGGFAIFCPLAYGVAFEETYDYPQEHLSFYEYEDLARSGK